MDLVHWNSCIRWISGGECITSKSSELQLGCLQCNSLSLWGVTGLEAARLIMSQAGSVMEQVNTNKSLCSQVSLKALIYEWYEARPPKKNNKKNKKQEWCQRCITFSSRCMFSKIQMNLNTGSSSSIAWSVISQHEDKYTAHGALKLKFKSLMVSNLMLTSTNCDDQCNHINFGG